MTRLSRRRWPRVLLAQAAILVVGFGGIEAYARYAYANPEYLRGMPFDAELGYGPAANKRLWCCDADGPFEYRLNSDGFRGPELPESPKQAGVRRLLFVGDSFLDGWRVRMDDLIPFSAERELEERGLGEFESYALTGKGLGTGQELLLYRRHVDRVDPDVVVLTFFVGNDVIDNSLGLVGHNQVSHGAYVRPFLVADETGELETRWMHPLRAWLRSWSRAYAVVECEMLGRGLLDSTVHASDEPWLPAPRARQGLHPHPRFALFDPELDDGPWEQAWRETEDILRAFHRDVTERGAAFLVVVIPSVYQVQRDGLRWSVVDVVRREADRSIDEWFDWNRPERRLASFFDAEGIPAAFLLDPLRRQLAEGGEGVYSTDLHLNGSGHRLGGRVAADAVEALLGGADPPGLELERAAPIDVVRLRYQDGGDYSFAKESQDELVGHRWFEWRCTWNDEAAGAWGMRSPATLPYWRAEGTLTVRCRAPLSVPLPATYFFEAGGVPVGEPVSVTDYPEFEMTLELPAPVRGVEQTSLLRIHRLLEEEGQQAPWDLLMTGISFRRAGGD